MTNTETVSTIEMDVTIVGEYLPGRPAPFTMNRESAAYADPGDDDEVDDLHVYLELGCLDGKERELMAKQLIEHGRIEITDLLTKRELEEAEDAIRDTL